MRDIPDYADVFTVQEFYQDVRAGGFINYDGSGYPANPPFMSDEPIDCSEIYKGVLPIGFTHIAWFNK